MNIALVRGVPGGRLRGPLRPLETPPTPSRKRWASPSMRPPDSRLSLCFGVKYEKVRTFFSSGVSCFHLLAIFVNTSLYCISGLVWRICCMTSF